MIVMVKELIGLRRNLVDFVVMLIVCDFSLAVLLDVAESKVKKLTNNSIAMRLLPKGR